MSDITGDAEGPEPIEPTEPVVPAPVVPAPVAPVTPDPEPTPAPAAAKVGEERQAFNSFIAAVVPVLKTPIVVTTALAVLLALVTSLVVSTIVAMLVNLIAGDDLPDDGGAWWEFAWSAHFTSHQVPFANDDTWIALHPFLFLAIALASAGFGVWLAHRLLAGRGAKDATVAAPAYSPLVAALTFAATYTVANLILSAFGPEDLGIRLLLGIILTFVIAWLAARWVLARTGTAGPAASAAAPTATAVDADRPGWLARTWRAVAIPATTLVGMIVVASVLTLVANVIEVLADDDVDTRPALTYDVTHVLDQGWATVGWGLLASATAETDVESDGDDEDSEGDEEEDPSLRIWDMRDDDLVNRNESTDLGFGGEQLGVGDLNVASFIIILLTGFGTVLIGGLYAGFRVAKGAGRALSRRDGAIAGAIVGPVWAALTVVLTLVVTDRLHIDAGIFELHFTTVDGIEVFFLALGIGALLGAIGGLLAAEDVALPIDVAPSAPAPVTPPA